MSQKAGLYATIDSASEDEQDNSVTLTEELEEDAEEVEEDAEEAEEAEEEEEEDEEEEDDEGEDEDEVEVFEFSFNGKTYFATDSTTGTLYDNVDGEVGDEIGSLKKGVPFLY